MSIEAKIETNPLDALRSGQIFLFKEGQTVIIGEFIAELGGEYIVPDQGSVIQLVN